MKKEAIFLVSWIVAICITMYVFHRFTGVLLIKSQDSIEFGTEYAFLQKRIIPLLSFIIFGIEIGILLQNMEYLSFISKIVLTIFGLYLILLMPLLTINTIFHYIYPRWIYLTNFDMRNCVGGLVLGTVIFNSGRNKLTFFKNDIV